MSVHLSKNAQISVGGTAIGQVMGFSWSETDGLVDITNFDSSLREFAKLGLLDRELSLEVHWDLGDTGQDAVRTALAASTASEVIIYPEGNTSSLPTLTADALVYDHQVDATGVEGVISGTFTLKFTEAFAEGTVSP